MVATRMTFPPNASLQDREAAYAGLIKELSADRQPIIVGPWRSELGFEVSYWIPFLRKLAAVVPNFASRAVTLTRGGASCLYTGLALPGSDLFALRDVTEVRRENLYDQQVRQKGATQKQVEPTDWDDAVCADLAEATKMRLPYHVVHPAWMYWLCAPYWNEDVGLRPLLNLCDFSKPLPKPILPADVLLPPKYVAVRFYGRHTLPTHDPVVRDLIKQVVATIAAQLPVVVLRSGGSYDDHADLEIEGRNIWYVNPTAAEHNISAQMGALSRAAAFVGTYGGVAQAALGMGIPSVGLYQNWGGTAHAHLSLSSWLSKQTKVPFVVGSIGDVGLWRQLTSVPASVLQAKPDAVAV